MASAATATTTTPTNSSPTPNPNPSALSTVTEKFLKVPLSQWTGKFEQTGSITGVLSLIMAVGVSITATILSVNNLQSGDPAQYTVAAVLIALVYILLIVFVMHFTVWWMNPSCLPNQEIGMTVRKTP